VLMSKLVLLGGPVGVGKTTVTDLLAQQLADAAFLDADHVWRMSAVRTREPDLSYSQRNVIAVVKGYFDAGSELVILNWVFARSELYQPVIDALTDRVDEVQQIYLTASPECLISRITKRAEAMSLDDSDQLIQYSLSRLEMIAALPFPKLDTTDQLPSQVAAAIMKMIVKK